MIKVGTANDLRQSDVHVTVHRDKFLIIKPTRCTNFSNLFCIETLHVSDSSSVHHREFFTVHTPMVCHTGLLTAGEQDQDGTVRSILILLTSCLQTCMTYTIGVCTVNSWWWTEEPSETCRVSIQNKFEKLVHLVGFIIRDLRQITETTDTYWTLFEVLVYKLPIMRGKCNISYMTRLTVARTVRWITLVTQPQYYLL